MTPNRIIKNRRIQLGLQEADVAGRAGLTVHEYADIELNPEEVVTVTDLQRVKRLCSILRLPIGTVLGVAEIDSKEAGMSSSLPTLMNARESTGLTTEQLAAILGMDTWVIEKIERDESAIDHWPFEFVASYAKYLGLPVSRFID